jgi:hypothetical protein
VKTTLIKSGYWTWPSCLNHSLLWSMLVSISHIWVVWLLITVSMDTLQESEKWIHNVKDTNSNFERLESKSLYSMHSYEWLTRKNWFPSYIDSS